MLKLKKEGVVLGFPHAFMGIQKLVEEETHGNLFVALLDMLIYHDV